MKNEETQELNLNAADGKKGKPKNKQVPKLNLTVSTWEKQSHGLFDYQSPPQKISKEDLTIQQSSRVFRNLISRKTVVREMKDDFKDQPQKIQIFNVQYDPNIKSYILKNSLPTHLDEIMLAQTKQNECISQKHKLYISLGPNNLAFHKLVIGDFIKLGRVQLVVLQINNEQKTESLDFQQIYGSKEYIFHLKEELQGACKVCLSDQATEEDPLVNPCNCKGSCGVIHLGCLKNWINNKVKREIIGKVKTYNFEKYSCEICKAPFPSMIRLQNGTESLLLNFERPSSPYILLQQLSQTEEKQAKTLHFILSEEGNNEVSIGRGQNCELNISDISVSRSHSKIKYENNSFNIYDTTSKFGTLVELKRELIVNSNIRLQHNGCSIDIGLKDEKKQRSKSGKKGVQKNE